jgi:hypothetical protein
MNEQTMLIDNMSVIKAADIGISTFEGQRKKATQGTGKLAT